MTLMDEILAEQKLILDKLNALFPNEETEEMEMYVEPPLSTYDLVAMCMNAFNATAYIDEEEQAKMTDVAVRRVNRIKSNALKIIDECLKAEAELLFEDKP
jgi:hypothetical protein